MAESYLVFGSSGSIGKEVVERLHYDGNFVAACSKGINPALRGSVQDSVWDVADRNEMDRYAKVWEQREGIDGIVYAVGHCPANGFPEAIRYPFSKLPLQVYLREISMHQIGVLNVFQCMLDRVVDGGCFVFLSSAITRLKGQFPPFLQAHYHAGVIAAEDWLIDGMRADPTVKERQIKIHRIAPAAVDTHFHHGGPKPPKLIPISEVVTEVVNALKSREIADKQIT